MLKIIERAFLRAFFEDLFASAMKFLYLCIVKGEMKICSPGRENNWQAYKNFLAAQRAKIVSNKTGRCAKALMVKIINKMFN